MKCPVVIVRFFSLLDGGDWGLNDSDMEASVATVRSLCEQLDADLIPLRDRSEAAGLVRDYLIRRRVGELDFLEVRLVLKCLLFMTVTILILSSDFSHVTPCCPSGLQ